jgi:hypothetical protein
MQAPARLAAGSPVSRPYNPRAIRLLGWPSFSCVWGKSWTGALFSGLEYNSSPPERGARGKGLMALPSTVDSLSNLGDIGASGVGNA